MQDQKNLLLFHFRSVQGGEYIDYGTHPDLEWNSLNNLEPSKQQQTRTEDKKPLYQLILGYSFLAITAISYMISVVSAQLIVQKTSLLVVCLYKALFQLVLSLVIIIVAKLPLSLNRECGPYMLCMVVCGVLFSILFFLAGSMMPAGNNEATFTGVFIILAAAWDLFRDKISKLAIPASFVIVLGMVCLIQPWVTSVKELVSLTPCECLENSTQCVVQFAQLSNGTVGAIDTTHLPNVYIGYLIAALASTITVFYCNVVQKAAEKTDMMTILFWTYSGATIVFLILTGIASYFTNVDYRLPSGKYCFIFTLTFVCGSGLASVVCMWMYKYIPVSAGGQTWPLVTTVLYICQRTFLSDYHPGESNASEISGIVLIIVGSFLSTIITSLYQTKKLKF